MRGVVYDSVGRTPLAGAVVQAVLVDSTRSRGASGPIATFVAVADTAGRFLLTNVPDGLFAVGFQHEALDALGLESPIRPLVLSRDTSATLDLSIPPGPAVSARACPRKKDAWGYGMMAGYVLDARTGAAMKKAEVQVQWTDLGILRGRLQSEAHAVKSAVGDDGLYRACGIPTDGPISIHVSLAGFHDVDLETSLPIGGVARRDFRLVDVNAVHGSGVVALRVVDDSGAMVTSAQATVPVLGREVLVKNGEASIGDMPSGTWMVLLRAFGYQPRVALVDVPPEGTIASTVTLLRFAQLLDTVNVVSNQPRIDRAVLAEIDQRMRVAAGTLIRANDPYLRSAINASDAVRGARGFTQKGPTTIVARPYVTRSGRLSDCVSVASSTDRPSAGGKVVAVYLDGTRYPGGLDMVNNAVPPDQILAIEAYPDILSAPFLWRTNDACAVVAFWTKH